MMVPTPAVMEKVQQRAGENQEVGQESEYVRTVLGEEEKCGDAEEHQQGDAGAPRTAVRVVISVGHQ
jgi:hypothetical protein